ncbi:2TM domain-containing protein [Tamlana sp. 2201CG12-4]|uniref:2TM domain-containing protein n=1 Tax=Tamlana sp. 2201CG12-4 TaxID=3112582 RepID=UPI002DBA13F7|nr:2TM domain-containing protein [Tamlana sp. 2201CG12-4]MEC3908298.1 2TM domain-containing protein [Tamlana sp. 2201CG12-4]
MKTQEELDKSYIRAKEKVRHIKVFYVHLVGYIIVVLLLLYNLYIIDENNEYADFFTWFNSIIILAWTVFIFLHGRFALKGKQFFKKTWEERKLKAYMDKQEKKWE